MAGKRTRYSAEFKAKVVLEATGSALRIGLSSWISHYNARRAHSASAWVSPAIG
jgi:hypothetical protein